MEKRILFRVDGYRELGLGHIYNCLTLAEHMKNCQVLFVLHKRSDLGVKKIADSKYKYHVIETDKDIPAIITEFNPDIWVNDCLDSDESFIRMVKNSVPRVVTIEDRGTGIKVADIVINALYEDMEEKNVYSGWQYACLRKEFLDSEPIVFREKVSNVVILFGGTDPSNYNKMLYKVIMEIGSRYHDIRFNFITGFGYDAEKNGIITSEEDNIYVYSNVKRVSKYMKEADIAITSQGRTIFELAAMGVPSIVLSQNEREQTHTFAQMEHGFLNLGLRDVSADLVKNTLDWLINTPPIRRNMHDLMLRLPMKSGVERVKKLILNL